LRSSHYCLTLAVNSSIESHLAQLYSLFPLWLFSNTWTLSTCHTQVVSLQPTCSLHNWPVLLSFLPPKFGLAVHPDRQASASSTIQHRLSLLMMVLKSYTGPLPRGGSLSTWTLLKHHRSSTQGAQRERRPQRNNASLICTIA